MSRILNMQVLAEVKDEEGDGSQMVQVWVRSEDVSWDVLNLIAERAQEQADEAARQTDKSEVEVGLGG